MKENPGDRGGIFLQCRAKIAFCNLHPRNMLKGCPQACCRPVISAFQGWMQPVSVLRCVGASILRWFWARPHATHPLPCSRTRSRERFSGKRYILGGFWFFRNYQYIHLWAGSFAGNPYRVSLSWFSFPLVNPGVDARTLKKPLPWLDLQKKSGRIKGLCQCFDNNCQ